MNEKVVIIGAGGTGRGFLARLLQEDGAIVTFVDKNAELIQKLNTEESYKIKHGKNLYTVQDYDAYEIVQEEAFEAAASADWIFISVGNENLPELSGFLKKAAEKKKDQTLRIVVCENGTAPKLVLRNTFTEKEQKQFQITQGVIFCSSIPAGAGKLDILAQAYEEIPYDVDEELFELPFAHFKQQKNFSELLERKIYTYNCLSACIAYLGAYKGYTDYADAGNDPEIVELCHRLLQHLNPAICRKYQIPEEEQQIFSEQAMQKFSSRDISDTIYKNARAAIRKLSPGERIMGPIQIMRFYDEDPEILYLTAAAALWYLKEKERPELKGIFYEDLLALFKVLNPELPDQISQRIRNYYAILEQGIPLKEILS